MVLVLMVVVVEPCSEIVDVVVLVVAVELVVLLVVELVVVLVVECVSWWVVEQLLQLVSSLTS